MQDINFSLGYLNLAGLTNGKHNKPIILALHGWLDNAASFMPLAPYLNDYQLIAVDFCGHGHSQHRSEDAHYHFVDWVHDLHALIISQKWRNVVLLGHSMGGIVSSVYAGCFPQNVKALVSIEAMGPLTADAQTSPQQLQRSIESRIGVRSKVARHPDSIEQAVQARIMAGSMTKSSAELLVKRNLVTVDTTLRWRTDRRLRTLSSLRITEPQARAFMENIECPTLVMSGDSGFDKVRNNIDARMDWIPQAKHIETQGGHHLHMDYPQSAASEINRFLNQVIG